jgi:hypothetical protein
MLRFVFALLLVPVLALFEVALIVSYLVMGRYSGGIALRS